MLDKCDSFRVRGKINLSDRTIKRWRLEHARVNEPVEEDLSIPAGGREPDSFKGRIRSCDGAAGDVLRVILPFREYGSGVMVVDDGLARHAC